MLRIGTSLIDACSESGSIPGGEGSIDKDPAPVDVSQGLAGPTLFCLAGLPLARQVGLLNDQP